MKISLILLVSIILTCLFKGILSSNPDSVVVQDSSEDSGESKSAPLRIEGPDSAVVPASSKSNRRSRPVPIVVEDSDSVIVLDSFKGNGRNNRSAPIRVEDGQQIPLRGAEGPRGYQVVRIRRPYAIGSKLVWREIGLQNFDSDRDPLYSVWRDFDNNRRMLPGSTGQNVFRAIPYSSNVPQNPQNNDEGNNRRVQAFGGKAVTNLPSYDEPIKSLPETDRSGFINRNNGAAQIFPPPQSNYNPQNRILQGNNNPYSPRFVVNAANLGERRVPLQTQTPNYRGQRPPPVPENTSNRRSSPDSKLFASIVNNFAFKLVGAMDLESNFVISPLSIFIALSMCYLGSDGRTKIQLEQVLGMNDNAVHGQRLHQGMMDLISLVTAESSNYELFQANGMFLGKNFTPNALFGEDIRKYYAAELVNLDFENPQASIPVINNWVARQTRNMITNLISIPPPVQTRLLLLNAIYFRGIWKTMFPVNLTADGPFRSADGTNKVVPTMTLMDESFPFFRSDEHRHSFIKLPYDGDQMSMIIALPYGESDRPMPAMTDEILCNLRESMVNTQFYAVSIPKFRREFTSSLRRALLQLGISDIFNRNVVNMTKLRVENDVYVSAILHKAIVEVNEGGTTAAAATAVRFVPLIRNMTSFVASHPFAFYIVHERSGLVVFYGKILDLDGKAPDYRREGVNVRPRPNPENNGRENVNFRPRPNSEENRREGANVRPGPNPEDNRRENVNFRPGPNPEDNRRENVNIGPRPSPEDNRRDNVNFRPGPNSEDSRRENINIGPRPEDNRRENLNVRPRPNPEGFGGTTVNRNPSRTRIHGGVNFENTE